MKSSIHTEMEESELNIFREHRTYNSGIHQKVFDEISNRNISPELGLRRMSNSGANLYTHGLDFAPNQGLSWQMTKELSMTVEERNACEKKAERFESRLLDLMKNIEKKYKEKPLEH